MISYANFIPMRMKSQAWEVGNIPILKILIGLVGVIIPVILFMPLFAIEDSFAKTMAIVLTVGFVIFNEVVIWIRHSSGHPIYKYLYLKLVYQISYNHFKNAGVVKIFNIYKYKTEVKKINESVQIKFDELKKNEDGSWSIKVKKEILKDDKSFDELRKEHILKLKDGEEENKTRYFVGFKVLGYDIGYKTQEQIENIILSLHNIVKNISVPHTLIKIAQPVNFKNNIDKLSLQQEVVERNPNKGQLSIQSDILHLDKKRFLIDDRAKEYATSSQEMNWYLIIHSENLSEIRNLKDQLITDFNKIKITMNLLTQKQLSNVFISLYAPYISFDDDVFNQTDTDKWNDLLNFASIEFYKSYTKVKPALTSISENTFMKVGVIETYPTISPEFAWLYKIASSFDALVMHNNIVDKEVVHKQINASFENTELKRSSTVNKSKKQEMEFLYNSFKLLSDSIASGNEQMFESTIYTINYAFDNFHTVNKSFEQSRVACKSLGFGVRSLTFEQRSGFADLFIKSSYLLSKSAFPLPAYCYAYGFPFITSSLNDYRGILLGTTTKKEQFVFDITQIDNNRKNHNMFILGSSGTGKSTFLKVLWMHLFARGHKIFIVDPEAEDNNEMLVNNLKGTYIDMAQKKINPMIVNIYNEDKKTGVWTYDIQNKSSWLSEWMGIIFGFTKNDTFQTNTKTVLSNYLTKFYQSLNIHKIEVNDKVKWPSIGDFYTWLKKETENIDLLVKMNKIKQNIDKEKLILESLELHFIHSENVTAKLWNTHSNEVDLTKSYLNSFNISKLINLQEHIQRASYMLLLDLANKEMWRNKIYNDAQLRENPNHNQTFLFLFFDEGHLMVDSNNPITTIFLAETGARCRKYSTGLIVATQNVSTFTADAEILKHSTRIINNSQYSMSLGLREHDIASLNELWSEIGGLTDTEKHFLASAQKGDAIFSTTSQSRFMIHVDISNDIAFKKYASFIKDDSKRKIESE